MAQCAAITVEQLDRLTVQAFATDEYFRVFVVQLIRRALQRCTIAARDALRLLLAEVVLERDRRPHGAVVLEGRS